MNKTEKFLKEITEMQRDMAYKFIENHHLMKKFKKWWDKQIRLPHNKSTRGKE